MLIDSSMKYELLKPAYFNLKTSFQYQSKELDNVQNENRLLKLQMQVDKQSYESKLEAERRKGSNQRWKGRIEGFVIGLLVPI